MYRQLLLLDVFCTLDNVGLGQLAICETLHKRVVSLHEAKCQLWSTNMFYCGRVWGIDRFSLVLGSNRLVRRDRYNLYTADGGVYDREELEIVKTVQEDKVTYLMEWRTGNKKLVCLARGVQGEMREILARKVEQAQAQGYVARFGAFQGKDDSHLVRIIDRKELVLNIVQRI